MTDLFAHKTALDGLEERIIQIQRCEKGPVPGGLPGKEYEDRLNRVRIGFLQLHEVDRSQSAVRSLVKEIGREMHDASSAQKRGDPARRVFFTRVYGNLLARGDPAKRLFLAAFGEPDGDRIMPALAEQPEGHLHWIHRRVDDGLFRREMPEDPVGKAG